MKYKIFISAGEVSGDLHASYLLNEILSIDKNIYSYGFGSLKLKKLGFDLLADLSKNSSVGFTEALPNVIPAIFLLRKAQYIFKNKKPDLVILIDNQGFNFKLAEIAKKNNIKVAYYIAPQEWIWGFKNGAKKVITLTDKIYAIFKKEYELYYKLTDKVEYVGHPLLDILKKNNKILIRKELNLNNELVIGLMPGSRKKEIDRLLPIFLETTNKLRNYYKNIDFIIIIPEIWEYYLKKFFKIDNIKIFSGDSSYFMQACDLILASSGTVTLEATLLNIPIISNYKLSYISYKIAKYLIKTDYFSLPNIISNKKIIEEFIQRDVNSRNLFEVSVKILENRDKIDYSEIKNFLLPYGAIKKTANSIYSFLKEIKNQQ
ncbi:MAG: lipid-A-disaccharide synthase [Candidatus Sericytochromatia bacterium]|nr:MAG: lipid-A-disaccharide synthase [Candidatus Sericytochromatia bacterium]